MRPLKYLERDSFKKIKLIVFDVDGILVPRGTKIKQIGNSTKIEIKKIKSGLIEKIKKLNNKGFDININSGRGLYMLQMMFSEILPIVSLTYENGSATWFKGRIFQHVNSFSKLNKVKRKLNDVTDKNIKGFEPKEFIITLHCKRRVKKIEKIISKEKGLYFIWNSEAYDIGIKKVQTKVTGLKKLMTLFKIKKENVMVIGDNFNDRELLDAAGISVTADKSRVSGDFYVPLKGKLLPAEILINRLLQI